MDRATASGVRFFPRQAQVRGTILGGGPAGVYVGIPQFGKIPSDLGYIDTKIKPPRMPSLLNSDRLSLSISR